MKNHSSNRLLTVAAIAFGIVAPAQAADYTWGGATSTWTDTSATGWNGGPPVGGDTATINSGSVDVNHPSAPGATASITIGSGATLMTHNTYTGTPYGTVWQTYNHLILNGGTVTGDGSYEDPSYSFGTGVLKTVTAGGTAASTISASSFFNLYGYAATVFDVADATGSSATDLTVSAVLKNQWDGTPSALLKTGAGTMALTSVNTYTGGTTVDAGTLLLNGNGGSGLIRGTLTVNANGTVIMAGDDTGLGYYNQPSKLVINGGVITTAAKGHVWNISGGIEMTGGTLQSNNGISSSADGYQLEWHNTNVTTFASANTATIAGGVRLRADGGGFGMSFNVADGAAATDLLVSANIREFTGYGGPAQGLTKSGAGNLTLTGTNTYTGDTTVAAGVLAVDGSLGATAVTVTGGTLQGSGTIAGAVAVQSGGTLATGNSIESLGVGGLDLQAGSDFAYEIDRDAAAGVSADLTYLTAGTMSVANDARLSISELGTSGTWAIDTKLTLIAYTGGAWTGGLFDYYVGNTLTIDNLADGATISGIGGRDWIFNYDDTVEGQNYTGDTTTQTRFMTITAIPEPTAATLGLLAAAGLLVRRRRAH